MIRRPPRSTQSRSSAASDVYKRQHGELNWDKSILKEFGIPIESLPAIKTCSENFGTLNVDGFEGVPITGNIGDQQAASLGHQVLEVGDSKNTYGTGCFFLMNIGDKPKFSDKGLLTTVLSQLGQDQKVQYAFEGAIESGGSILNWAKSNMNLFQNCLLYTSPSPRDS
eukprot:TRINITY_DN15725_c0_g1_i2.p3 TRINITY_DN15725_c0_g1~~TRINITY_DN15725_c0_g1_i2.p3  ORF type:complete len:168 (-),score=63.92 TRINITY_DN15725_c0_g1_i2:38-541(-)